MKGRILKNDSLIRYAERHSEDLETILAYKAFVVMVYFSVFVVIVALSSFVITMQKC